MTLFQVDEALARRSARYARITQYVRQMSTWQHSGMFSTLRLPCGLMLCRLDGNSPHAGGLDVRGLVPRAFGGEIFKGFGLYLRVRRTLFMLYVPVKPQ